MSENEIKPVGYLADNGFGGALMFAHGEIPEFVALAHSTMLVYDQSAIDRLTAELEVARYDAKVNASVVVANQEEIDRLTAERDALRVDAERYRWIRLRIGGAEAVEDDFKWEYESGECLAQDVDAAIDAARAKEPQA